MGSQPAMTFGEDEECEQLVRADPGFQEALMQRGVTAFDLVTVEAWGIGTHADERFRTVGWRGRTRWVRDDPDDNPTRIRSTACLQLSI